MTISHAKPHLKDVVHKTLTNTTVVTVQCPIGNGIHYVTITTDQWVSWLSYLRNETPTSLFDLGVSPNSAELLISGICPTCWDSMIVEDN